MMDIHAWKIRVFALRLFPSPRVVALKSVGEADERARCGRLLPPGGGPPANLPALVDAGGRGRQPLNGPFFVRSGRNRPPPARSTTTTTVSSLAVVAI